MGRKITAVVEDGVLRPTEPLELPEGETLELEVVRLREPDQAREDRIRAFEQALDRFQEEARQLPREWWDEFERDLEANRVRFEEPDRAHISWIQARSVTFFGKTPMSMPGFEPSCVPAPSFCCRRGGL